MHRMNWIHRMEPATAPLWLPLLLVLLVRHSGRNHSHPLRTACQRRLPRLKCLYSALRPCCRMAQAQLPRAHLLPAAGTALGALRALEEALLPALSGLAGQAAKALWRPRRPGCGRTQPR